MPANAAYKRPLVDRAVDLVQLFAAAGTKNGADIRLAVDAVEDLVQHADISHVVFVAGDSDYVPLAQRCKRLGRYVVGIGVAGSTSRALVSACDEFSDYDALPGVIAAAGRPARIAPAKKTSRQEGPAKKAAAKKTAKKTAAKKAAAEEPAEAAASHRRAARAGRGDVVARPGGPGRPAEERRRVDPRLRA